MEEHGFRIGQWRIRPSLSQIEGSDREIHVNPKAMEVLVELASRPGEVLSKEALLEKVWADTFVTEAVLTSAIWELRKAFEDDARKPRFIQTIPKRGYRLIPPVEPLAGTAEVPAAPASGPEPPAPTAEPNAGRPPARTAVVAVLGAALAALVLYALWGRGRERAGVEPGDSGEISIAILPFDNNTGEPELDWLRQGIPDMLALDLSRSSYLRVISLETVSGILGELEERSPAIRGAELAREVQRRAGARVVVTGRTMRDPTRFLILAQLHDFVSGEQTAEEAQASTPEAVLELADQIATKIRLALEIEASDLPGVEEGLQRTKTHSVEAYKHYVDGRGHLETLQVKEAVTDLQKAVELDDSFAHAYELLANAYDIMGEIRLSLEAITSAVASSDDLPRVEQVLILRRKAQLELDFAAELGYLRELVALQPKEALWQSRLAWFYQTHVRDCDQSIARYREAIELEPDASPYFYAYLADAYLACSNPAAALSTLNRYAELLPGDVTTHRHYGYAYLHIGDYERAAAEFEAALDRQPDFTFALSGLGDVYRAQGRFAESEGRYLAMLAQALGPNDEEDALTRLGELELERGRPRDAADYARRALAVDEESASGYWLLGLAQVELADLEAARSAATSLSNLVERTESKHSREMLHHLRAKILLAEGEADRAVEALLAALALNPLRQDFYRDALAEARLRSGDLERAAQAYRAVFEVNPRFARSRCNYGQVLERLDEAERAVDEYTACTGIWRGTGNRPAWLARAEARLAALETPVDVL